MSASEKRENGVNMGYLGEGIGKLGFGLMRLPRLEDGSFDHELI